jgi:hypothetical protein
MKTFKSPQTSSVYAVVFEVPSVLVCVRDLGEDGFRVRIQGSPEILEAVSERLFVSWGEIKDGDHLSVVVPTDEKAAHAIADAVQAVLKATDFLSDLPVVEEEE